MQGAISNLDRVFEECLEALEDERWTLEDCLERYPTFRRDLEPLLRTALRLREGRSLRAPQTFRRQAVGRLQARLRASRRPPVSQGRLRSEGAAAARRGRTGLGRPRSSLRWATLILSAIFALSGLGGGVVLVADAAAPGEWLYAVDRAVEDLQIRLISDPGEIAQVRLEHASERLDEANQLLIQGSVLGAQDALVSYQAEIQAAQPAIVGGAVIGGQAMIAESREVLQDQQVRLEAMLTTAPAEANAIIQATIQNVQTIQGTIVVPSGQGTDSQVVPSPTMTPTRAPH